MLDLKERNSLANTAKNLSRFFEIDPTIKVFGVTIFNYHYPPKSKD